MHEDLIKKLKKESKQVYITHFRSYEGSHLETFQILSKHKDIHENKVLGSISTSERVRFKAKSRLEGSIWRKLGKNIKNSQQAFKVSIEVSKRYNL